MWLCAAVTAATTAVTVAADAAQGTAEIGKDLWPTNSDVRRLSQRPRLVNFISCSRSKSICWTGPRKYLESLLWLACSENMLITFFEGLERSEQLYLCFLFSLFLSRLFILRSSTFKWRVAPAFANSNWEPCWDINVLWVPHKHTHAHV